MLKENEISIAELLRQMQIRVNAYVESFASDFYVDVHKLVQWEMEFGAVGLTNCSYPYPFVYLVRKSGTEFCKGELEDIIQHSVQFAQAPEVICMGIYINGRIEFTENEEMIKNLQLCARKLQKLQ